VPGSFLNSLMSVNNQLGNSVHPIVLHCVHTKGAQNFINVFANLLQEYIDQPVLCPHNQGRVA
jgi:hypothetical protein